MNPTPVTSTDSDALAERLAHVYWIGGGSGAGKSTIAHHLAEQHGMRLYATDDVMADHARRTAPEQAPYLKLFADMSLDERWVTRSPQDMLDTFHWYHGEGFHLVVDDLLQLPTDAPVVVDGFRLLPPLVAPLLAHPDRAVWLLPTPQFRRAVFTGRGGPDWGFLAKTRNPPQALANLLARDGMFTDRLAEQADRLGLHAITVEPSLHERDLVQQVSKTFGL